MSTTLVKEDELREKIKTVLSRLDGIESRVKVSETALATVSKLETKLADVIERVEKVESRIEPDERPGSPKREHTPISTPRPVKAFVSGISIGLLVIGLVVAAWFLGLL